MKEFIEESEYVTFNNGFGEAYDKEWALKDWGRSEGIEKTNRDVALKMLKKNIPIETISEITNLKVEEIEKLK